jgi:hypothetical protein
MTAKHFTECTGESQSDDTDLPHQLHSVRLSDEARAAVEAWAQKQADKPIISEAIRRLIDHGLATD